MSYFPPVHGGCSTAVWPLRHSKYVFQHGFNVQLTSWGLGVVVYGKTVNAALGSTETQTAAQKQRTNNKLTTTTTTMGLQRFDCASCGRVY